MTDTPTRALEPMVATGRPGLRGLLVVLGVAGAVVVAGLAVWLGSAPGETPGSPSLPETPALTAEGESEETTEAQQAEDEPIPLPLVSYELFLARDPFQPVVPDPASETGPSSPNGSNGTSGNGTTGGNGTTDGNGSSNGSGTSNGNSNGNSSGNSNGGCSGDTEVVCDGRVLTVIEVFEQNGELLAVVQVDTMRYQVGVGDVFADNFQTVSISPDQVRVLYGDSVVTIQVGDNALK